MESKANIIWKSIIFPRLSRIIDAHPSEENLSQEEIEHHRHILSHKILHSFLDELCADYISLTEKTTEETSVMELIKWSFSQTKNPTKKN